MGLASVYAQPYAGSYQVVETLDASKGANCTPPTTTTFMELNNVRAMVHTAGNLWQVPGQNLSQYEVPKNSGIMALFTSALWLGGTDVNGQLKLAALRYRNGQDYWTGPLTEGAAETDYDNCAKYDRHYITSQDEIREFDAWFTAGIFDQENGTSTQSENYPGYVIPEIIKDYPEVQTAMGGQGEEGMDGIKWFLFAFAASIVMMLIILSLNFSSFYQARLIVMVIPVGFFGAVLGHGIEGFNFSMLGLFGVIALAGVLVNDSVVMLDTYNRLLRNGVDPKIAAYECGKSRFRPVILTTITTVAGLYPLILEDSFQAQFLVPMAITIAYGVLFGTLILVFFFPPLILFLNDMKRSRWWLWRGGKYPPSRMEVEPVLST